MQCQRKKVQTLDSCFGLLALISMYICRQMEFFRSIYMYMCVHLYVHCIYMAHLTTCNLMYMYMHIHVCAVRMLLLR